MRGHPPGGADARRRSDLGGRRDSRAPAGEHVVWVQVRTLPGAIGATRSGEIAARELEGGGRALRRPRAREARALRAGARPPRARARRALAGRASSGATPTSSAATRSPAACTCARTSCSARSRRRATTRRGSTACYGGRVDLARGRRQRALGLSRRAQAARARGRRAARTMRASRCGALASRPPARRAAAAAPLSRLRRPQRADARETARRRIACSADDPSRGGVEARARVGRGAAVVEAGDGRAVRAVAGQRAPEVGLAELAVPGVDVAAHEVRVAALELDRRERRARAPHLPASSRRARRAAPRTRSVKAPVSASSQPPVADVDLARGVAAGRVGDLLELDPQHARGRRGPASGRRTDGWPTTIVGCGRQQAGRRLRARERRRRRGRR